MSSLPDDVWMRVLELGTKTRRLDHRDLCNLAMVNSEFNKMSSHPSLWATLFSHDFASSHYPSSDSLQNYCIATSSRRKQLGRPKMESLPDDIWHKILQIGTEEERLDHTDLCSLAIVNSHFDQLTRDPALWATLVSRDFPLLSFFQVPSKALYERKHKIKRVHERLLNMWNNEPWHDVFWPFETLDYPPNQFSHSESLVYSGPQLNLPDNDLINPLERLSVLSLREAFDPVLPQASQPSLREARNRYYENKPSKRFDKSSRTKVIPNSKSYIPMNRPPRRSMPRKN